MARFCGQCGTLASETTVFCGSCGSRIQPVTPPETAATPQPPAAYASVPVQPSAGAYTAVPVQATLPGPMQKSSSPFLKILAVVVVVLFVGGALALAGIYYAYHKVSEKAHEIRRQVMAESSSSNSGSIASLLSGGSSESSAGNSDEDRGFQGDPCRFLSKQDVGEAVGVEVIRTESDADSCQYIVLGDPAEMTSKHLSAMIGSSSSASQQQLQTMQKMAGAFFKQQETSDKDLSAQAAKGEVTVLTLNFSSGQAKTEMNLNETFLGHLGGPSNGAKKDDLAGIGDEAFESGGTMLMMRKGNTVARFLYPSCPCSTLAIKPLASKVAEQL